eukprot:3343670-Rhodomonas_salina.2
MPSVEVSEILASLSHALMGSQLLSTERIIRFEAPNRLVFGKDSQYTYASPEQFWSMMHENIQDDLSSERRRDIFHQFQRSRACHLVTKVALMVLKILNEDKGLRLEHRGRTVNNVLAMNSQALDVSDIPGQENSMLLVNAETSEEMPLLAVEEEMEKRAPAEAAANVRQVNCATCFRTRHAMPGTDTVFGAVSATLTQTTLQSTAACLRQRGSLTGGWGSHARETQPGCPKRTRGMKWFTLT